MRRLSMSVPAVTGAQCKEHPSVAAVATCNRCGAFCCDACAVTTRRRRLLCVPCSRIQVLASRERRLVAFGIDVAAFAIVSCVVIYGSAMVAAILEDNGVSTDAMKALVLASFVYGPLVSGACQAVLLAMTSQSVGKWFVDVKVVRSDGGQIDWRRLVFGRGLLSSLAWVVCFPVALADAAAIFGAEQRCQHELLADTKVIRTRLE